MSAGKLIGEPEFYELEDEILKACVPSEEVRKHLNGKLSSIGMARLVCGAAIPLWQKEKFLWYICDFECDKEIHDCLSTIVQDVSVAAGIVDQEMTTYENESGKYVYTLEDCWYDYDILRHKEVLVGVFDTLLSATDYIRYSEGEDLSDCGEDERAEIWNAPCWWELRVWEKTDDSNKNGLKEYGCFYFLHDEAMWFDRTHALLSSGREQEEKAYREKLGRLFSTHYCHDSEFLKLPLPFKPGTVVEINTYPFGPVSVGIIVAYADFNDEDVMTLVRNYKGLWQLIDVSSAHDLGRFKEQDDWISPLYRLKTAEAENEEDKKIFDIVSEYIGQDQEKGRKLLNSLYHAKTFTDEELIEIIRKL